MQIVNKDTIHRIIDDAAPNDLISCIEKAFTEYSSGNAIVPPVGTLTFDAPPGDVHIKYGYIRGGRHYVIKIASGFYENPLAGLSSSNGMNLVFNQQNGLAEAFLLDEGYLTDVRTALAGAVVAKYFAPTIVEHIGIVGTGIQARLQLSYLRHVTDCRSAMVWGRNPEQVRDYIDDMGKQGFEVTTGSPADIAARCQIVVTTTPSKEPLLPLPETTKDMLVTAMGADTPGKQELHPAYIEKATLIAMDSRSQCTGHGEIHKALKNGLNLDDRFREIGRLITDPEYQRPHGIVVADLTGIATQDIQISSFVLNHMNS